MLKSFLMRSNSCHNGVYLSIVYKSNCSPIFVKKSASIDDGISRLKRETKGVTWCDSVTKESSISSTIDLPNYFSSNFNFIQGEKANYRDGYWINRNYIQRALVKYCEVWSELPPGVCVVHGDFSIDNLIFMKDSVVIIDWEHFSQEKIPKGFDALNLIYEQLYILLRKERLNDPIKEHVNLMFRDLYNCNCIDEVFWKNPLMTIRRFILDNRRIWGVQLTKLPVLKITPLQVIELDAIFSLC